MRSWKTVLIVGGGLGALLLVVGWAVVAFAQEESGAALPPDSLAPSVGTGAGVGGVLVLGMTVLRVIEKWLDSRAKAKAEEEEAEDRRRNTTPSPFVEQLRGLRESQDKSFDRVVDSIQVGNNLLRGVVDLLKEMRQENATHHELQARDHANILGNVQRLLDRPNKEGS